ncbi:hypothetical protein PMIN06_003955 [Paraphaeosphaeria minitans]
MSTAEQPSIAVSRGDEGAHYQHCRNPLVTRGIFQAHSEESASGYQHSENFFDLNEFCHADDDWEVHANTSDPTSYAVSNTGISPEKSISQAPQETFLDDEVLPRSVEKYDEASSLGYREQAPVSRLSYNRQPVAHSVAPELSSHMYTTSYYTKHTPEPAPTSNTKYSPFKARFPTSESASKHRKEATRFDRQPYRPPDTDHTIAEIERDRLYHIERVYNAMTCGDGARDNKGSIAMKRWVHGAYYDSSLVEAYAHKVLDCLLLQANMGFRGWVHNDYVADDRKGDDEDRDVTCEERLESLLRALREEKTICEDVMNSACQIRMFVNAPKAYANRKYQNRVGNSKRGRTKDSDPANGPFKVRKLNPRSVTRARRSGSTKDAEIDPNVRLESQPREVSSFPRAQAQFSPPSVFAGSPDMYRHQRLPPSQDFPSLQSRIHAISPTPPMDSPYAPRISTVPPQQHTPLMLPPALSRGNCSAPASPDDGQLVHNPESEQWPPMQQYGNFYHRHAESLFDGPWVSSDGRQDQACTGVGANLFVQHPEMADMMGSLKQDSNGLYDRQEFSQHWDAQQRVQQFPYQGSSDTRERL